MSSGATGPRHMIAPPPTGDPSAAIVMPVRTIGPSLPRAKAAIQWTAISTCFRHNEAEFDAERAAQSCATKGLN
eukprot:528600-Amphidinium_carterae.1